MPSSPRDSNRRRSGGRHRRSSTSVPPVPIRNNGSGNRSSSTQPRWSNIDELHSKCAAGQYSSRIANARQTLGLHKYDNDNSNVSSQFDNDSVQSNGNYNHRVVPSAFLNPENIAKALKSSSFTNSEDFKSAIEQRDLGRFLEYQNQRKEQLGGPVRLKDLRKQQYRKELEESNQYPAGYSQRIKYSGSKENQNNRQQQSDSIIRPFEGLDDQGGPTPRQIQPQATPRQQQPQQPGLQFQQRKYVGQRGFSAGGGPSQMQLGDDGPQFQGRQQIQQLSNQNLRSQQRGGMVDARDNRRVADHDTHSIRSSVSSYVSRSSRGGPGSSRNSLASGSAASVASRNSDVASVSGASSVSRAFASASSQQSQSQYSNSQQSNSNYSRSEYSSVNGHGSAASGTGPPSEFSRRSSLRSSAGPGSTSNHFRDRPMGRTNKNFVAQPYSNAGRSGAIGFRSQDQNNLLDIHAQNKQFSQQQRTKMLASSDAFVSSMCPEDFRPPPRVGGSSQKDPRVENVVRKMKEKQVINRREAEKMNEENKRLYQHLKGKMLSSSVGDRLI